MSLWSKLSIKILSSIWENFCFRMSEEVNNHNTIFLIRYFPILCKYGDDKFFSSIIRCSIRWQSVPTKSNWPSSINFSACFCTSGPYWPKREFKLIWIFKSCNKHWVKKWTKKTKLWTKRKRMGPRLTTSQHLLRRSKRPKYLANLKS